MSDAFSAVVGQLRFVSPGAAPHFADIAQLAEHLICNQGVGGSTPSISTSVAESSAALRHSEGVGAILLSPEVLTSDLPCFLAPSSSGQDIGLSRREHGFKSRWGQALLQPYAPV